MTIPHLTQSVLSGCSNPHFGQVMAGGGPPGVSDGLSVNSMGLGRHCAVKSPVNQATGRSGICEFSQFRFIQTLFDQSIDVESPLDFSDVIQAGSGADGPGRTACSSP